MKIVDTSSVLNKLSLKYVNVIEREERPELVNVKFCDIFPSFEILSSKCRRLRSILNKRLYRHQFEAFQALISGKNIILVSGTGSGKTEAWAIYSLSQCVKTLAIYPNLALAGDQISRLKDYCEAIGFHALEVNATIAKQISGLPEKTLIVVTNPAYLMTEIKAGGKLLKWFFRDLDLIVIDELDYYGSSRAALLIKMIEILVRDYCVKKPRVVVLTATLEGAENLGEILSRINGREIEVIRGKARRVENRCYIVLGDKLAIDKLGKNISKKPEMANLLKDFPENLFEVIINLQRELPPKEFFSIVPREIFETRTIDLLLEYLKGDEDGVTIVFTRTIEDAEKLAKRLKTKCREVGVDESLVATHHHLIDKHVRRHIEELARENKIKIIISPRTLEQGIDIGTVIRIVHYGLPAEVKQFIQREGRKGRREETPFTESIIIPISDKDRIVLRRGFESLRNWIQLGIERLFIFPNNEFLALFSALYKLFRKSGEGLTSKEYDLLVNLGLARVFPRLEPTKLGRIVWRNFQFYEYGPPYGVSREVLAGNRTIVLEDVSRRDLVLKFQLGYIDPQSDGVIIRMGLPGAPRVLEVSLRYAIRYSFRNNVAFLINAYYKYSAIKRKWGEKTDIVSDYLEGYLEPKSYVDVSVPQGFGLIRYYPRGVVWILESRSPKKLTMEGKELFLKAVKKISVSLCHVPKFVYSDFSYGYSFEVPFDPKTAEIGAAILLAYLRVKYKVSLLALGFYIAGRKDEENTTVKIWEWQAVGLLPEIKRIIKDLEEIELTDDLLFTIQLIDKEIYYRLITSKNKNDFINAAKVIINRLIEEVDRMR